MKTLSHCKCLNALTLKLLAMALMLSDHLWATVVPGSRWMTDLGRLAFPIFAFQLVEGWTRTRDRKRYIRRVFLFALLSEIPFDLMYGGTWFFPFHQNVLFSFWLSMLLMELIDWAKSRGRWACLAAVPAACALGYLLGTLLMVDYFGLGVLTVLLFYFCHGRPLGWLGELAGLVLINGRLMGGLLLPISIGGLTFDFPQQALAVLALLPIWLYNGRQGPHSRAIQYACYAFYPVHMLLLSVLWRHIL